VKAKWLSLVFYLFFRIGTFQWVTSEKNKKIPPPPSLASEVVGEPRQASIPAPWTASRRLGPAMKKSMTFISDFVKTLWSHLDSAASLLAR
jgi:hypothetical protein